MYVVLFFVGSPKMKSKSSTGVSKVSVLQALLIRRHFVQFTRNSSPLEVRQSVDMISVYYFLVIWSTRGLSTICWKVELGHCVLPADINDCWVRFSVDYPIYFCYSSLFSIFLIWFKFVWMGLTKIKMVTKWRVKFLPVQVLFVYC